MARKTVVKAKPVSKLFKKLQQFSKIDIYYLKTKYPKDSVEIADIEILDREVKISLEEIHLADLYLKSVYYNFKTNIYKDDIYKLVFY